jgi:hypothetical protein
MRNLDDEYFAAKFEEDCLIQRVAEEEERLRTANGANKRPNRRPYEAPTPLVQKLAEITCKRASLDKARRAPVWRRLLDYPAALAVLTALTAACLVCIVLNAAQIVTGFREVTPFRETVDLGKTSLSTLGAWGVAVEVILIGYLAVASVVGLYTIPQFARIRPRRGDTSLTHLILNCMAYVVLSSALPLLSKILGITNFDLLGSFGSARWLSNLRIVLLYNAVFAASAATCLLTRLTRSVREEASRRVALALRVLLPLDRIAAAASWVDQRLPLARLLRAVRGGGAAMLAAASTARPKSE